MDTLSKVGKPITIHYLLEGKASGNIQIQVLILAVHGRIPDLAMLHGDRGKQSWGMAMVKK